ncbi:MAG: hypothetical protein FJX75_28315, partial [Armatimonadetes bacterium]|nr:hypothetical protein [Armatimonadota bacterium]
MEVRANGADSREGPSEQARIVFCLALDLVRSTEAGLDLPTRRFDAFNRALVEQIAPRLEGLGLTGCLVKFGGDGWLVFADDVDALPALCCLALVMPATFQRDISAKTGIAVGAVPALRAAVCHGRDIAVALPDGGKDWVGDSARRATRAAGYCYPGEALVDDTVRADALRDFVWAPADLGSRPPQEQPKRNEEELTLHVLRDLRPEAASGLDAPECFIYALDALGKSAEAVEVASQVSDRLAQEAAEPDADQAAILRRWNRALRRAPTYAAALEMLRDMERAGVAPDVVTYSTLAKVSGHYAEAQRWLDTMRAEGIAPNVVTYNTLVSMAPDYAEAQRWLDTMRAEGIAPDVVTYNTLVSMAPDYAEAQRWLDTMRAEGIAPNVV